MITGGHAIMIEVEVPQAIQDAAKQWIAASSSRVAVSDPHITLLFLGRDLEDWVGEAMIQVLEEFDAFELAPFGTETLQHFEMFGRMEDSMVIEVKDGPLSTARNKMRQIFRDKFGIEPDTSFGFSPHITLGQGVLGDPAPVTIVKPELIKFNALIAKIGSNRTVRKELP